MNGRKWNCPGGLESNYSRVENKNPLILSCFYNKYIYIFFFVMITGQMVAAAKPQLQWKGARLLANHTVLTIKSTRVTITTPMSILMGLKVIITISLSRRLNMANQSSLGEEKQKKNEIVFLFQIWRKKKFFSFIKFSASYENIYQKLTLGQKIQFSFLIS